MPSAVFAQCSVAPCLAEVTVSASGDLLALSGSLVGTEDWQVVNVSRITGEHVVGPVTRWQTQDGEFTVEHLAGINPSGDLLVFFWSLRANWQVVNVSAITGQRVLGPVTNWQTQDGPFTIEHLVGVNADGDLMLFFWSPQADWQAANISTITGQKMANISATITGQPRPGQQAMTGQQVLGPVTNWQSQDGPFTIEHLAGVNADGDLVLFFWSPRADWQAFNISAVTGQRVVGPVTSWQVQDGPFIAENLAGVSSSGDLLVFFWSPKADWQVVNVSRITGKQVVGPVTSWVKGKIDHLAATGLNERGVYVFWNLGFGRQPNPGWGFCDVSQTGCTRLIFASSAR
ncbi:MAG: hypothetical protein V4568_03305 [Pseudomonadota bacterium]